MTEARYGVITLFDNDGQVQDFLASGFTPEEAQQLRELPDRLTFFDYLSKIEGPFGCGTSTLI